MTVQTTKRRASFWSVDRSNSVRRNRGRRAAILEADSRLEGGQFLREMAEAYGMAIGSGNRTQPWQLLERACGAFMEARVEAVCLSWRLKYGGALRAPSAVSGPLARRWCLWGGCGRLLHPPGAAALPVSPHLPRFCRCPTRFCGSTPRLHGVNDVEAGLFATLNHLHLCPPTMPIVVLATRLPRL